MERGTILFNNLELGVLRSEIINQGCSDQCLLNKLLPDENLKDSGQLVAVQISEEEAETMLDCMPIPSQEADPHLTAARIKIQQFISKCRFRDQA